MNKNLIHAFWGILIVFAPFYLAAEENNSSVAEFEVSENFLSQFSISGSKTAPFQRHGQTLHPDLKLNVQIKLKDSSNAIGADLSVGLNGVTTTHSSQRVGPRKRHQVNVTVKSKLEANYNQELHFNQSGLSAGTPKGYPKVTPTVYSSNDFRLPLINGIVNNAANSTAHQMAAQIIPKDKAELHKQVTTNLNHVTSEAHKMVKNALSQSTGLAENVEEIPFRSHFSSSSGDKGSVKLEFKSVKANADRKKAPELAHSEQEAAHAYLHEDMLNELIGKELAGKEMRIADLKDYLCGPKTKKFLDFCKEELPKEIQSLSVIFEKDNPVLFSFKDGKIGIKLNASFRLFTEKPGDSKAVLQTPDASVTGRTVPYVVDIEYALQGGKAKLAKLEVTEKNKRPARRHGVFGGLFGSHGNEDVPAPVADPSAVFLTESIRQRIYVGLKGALKEELEWPSASLPTKMKVDLNQDKPTTSLAQTGSLLPLSTQAKDGWLALSSYYCSEVTPSFGVSYHDSSSKSGIEISKVFAGSPASLIGLQVGDSIERIGPSSEQGELTGATEASFANLVATTALKEQTDERKLKIIGKDKSGNPFEKEIVLCPKDYPHRANAEKLIQGVKKATAP